MARIRVEQRLPDNSVSQSIAENRPLKPSLAGIVGSAIGLVSFATQLNLHFLHVDSQDDYTWEWYLLPWIFSGLYLLSLIASFLPIRLRLVPQFLGVFPLLWIGAAFALASTVGALFAIPFLFAAVLLLAAAAKSLTDGLLAD